MDLIDDLDKKILKQLLLDGRRSFVDIAKDCQVSNITVGKHFAKLKKEGVIIGSTLQINYNHLGLNTITHMSFRIKPEYAKETFEKIRGIKGLYRIAQQLQHASAVFVLSNNDELNEVKAELRKLNSVSDLRIHLCTGIRNQSENLGVLLCEGTKRRCSPISKEEIKEVGAIDELDIKLIDILSVNSRMSFRAVSKQLGTAIDTISRRYEQLKQNGTIKPIIQINPQKLGYHAYLGMDIRLTREGDFQAAFDKISELKNCLVIAHCSGEYDLAVEFIIKNLGDLLEIQDKMKEIPNIIVSQISTDRCRSIYPAPREQISTL